MESYVPVGYPQYLIALNQAYFPTVLSSPRKTVRAPSDIKNIIPDGLIYLNKKTELKILAIFNKHSSLLILTVLLLSCINATNNWLFNLQSFWYNLRYQKKKKQICHSNHFIVVSNVTLTVYPHIEFMPLVGCRTCAKLCDTWIVLKWYKKEVLQQQINAVSVTYVGYKKYTIETTARDILMAWN